MADQVLEQIVQSLYLAGKTSAGRLTGKPLPVGRNKPEVWICLDHNDHLHFLISDPSKTGGKNLTKIQLRNLKTGINRWIVSDRAESEFIDLCCQAERLSPFRKPFIAFCEDLLVSLRAKPDSHSEELVLRTYERWKRFWLADDSEKLKLSWIKGLLGELLVLAGMVDDHGPEAIRIWDGPDDTDYDFQAGGYALEVKTCSKRPAAVTIHGLRQLDHTQLKQLMLGVVMLSDGTNGITLPGTVARIESSLEQAPADREIFWDKLVTAGYRRHLEHVYSKHRFIVDGISVFDVGPGFPAVTVASFKEALDHRIHKFRYSIDLSGLAKVSKKALEAFIKRLIESAEG